MAQDQSVKKRAGAGKLPAEVQQAGGAHRYPPLIALEPGKLIGRFTDLSASGSLFKTADFKNQTMGIGKGVLMGSVHHDTLIAAGDDVQAVGAAQKRPLVRFPLGRFFVWTRLV